MEEETRARRKEFIFRLSATAAMVVGALALWHLADFVFLTFGAVLVALLLNAPARWLNQHTRIPYGLSVATVGLVLVGLFVGVGFLFGPALAEQIHEMSERLPDAFDRVVKNLQEYGWVQSLLQHAPDPSELMSGARGTLSKITGVLFNTIDAVTGVLVVVFVGIFLAVSPQTYFSGVLHLFPKTKRHAVSHALQKIGCTLRYWLLGQFTAMLIIGVATWAGLALLGVRMAVGLGLIAGLLEFIPTVGPVLSAVPAILIALVDSPQKALYVVLLYIGIQFAENHLLIPLVQRRAIQLPPALSLLAILLLATLFGFLGLLFAIPMAAALFVLVREAYVKRVLDDPLGEGGRD